MTDFARVIRVDSSEIGDELVGDHAAGAMVLQLDDAVDFNETGGALYVAPIGALTYVAADLELDTLTLAEPLASDLVDGEKVGVWDVTRQEVATVVEAQCVLEGSQDGGDAPEALVPHALRPLLPEGARQAVSEYVELTLVDGSWVVVDIPGRAAEIDAPTRVTDDLGESLAGTSAAGDLQGRDVDVLGDLRIAMSALVMDGTPFDELLLSLAKGVWSKGEYNPQVTGVGNAAFAVMGLPVYLPEDRDVALELETQLSMNTGMGGRFDVRIRYSYNADTEPAEPTSSSPVLALIRRQTITNTNVPATYNDMVTRTLVAGYYGLRIELLTITSGTTLSTSGPTRLLVTDRGPAGEADNQAFKPGSAGTLEPGGVDSGVVVVPQTRTETKTFGATWSRSYRGNGDQIASDYSLFVGDSGNGHGTRDTAIGFADAKIRDFLAGATLVKVEMFMFITSRPGGSKPGSAAFGYHGDSNPSGTWGAVGGKNADRHREADWGEGRGRWVNLTDAGSSGWASGSRRGVILTAPNDQREWAYGAYGPDRDQNTPTLRFTVER